MMEDDRIPFDKLPECDPAKNFDCTKEECFINGGECHKRVPKCEECKWYSISNLGGCVLKPYEIILKNDFACSRFLEGERNG